jgi:hypothetical protein
MIRVRFVSSDGDSMEVEAEVAIACSMSRRMLASRSRARARGRWRARPATSSSRAEDFARLPRASEEEEDMLDLAIGAARTSRLACQIVLSAELDGLTVRMPPQHRDMQGR